MRNNNILIILLFVSSMVFSQDARDFKTPESVMQYFVDNFKIGNFDNVFLASPFSDDSLVKKINPREMLNYTGIVLFHLDPNLPLQYHSIIKINLLGQYSAGLKRFIFSLLLSEKYPELVNLYSLEISDLLLDNYFSLLEIKNLLSLELIRMDIYLPEIQFSERGKNNALRQYNKILGCDEKIEYTVLYKHNGNYYAGGVIVVRYGENWYIESLSGTYSNISIGGLIKVTGISDYLNEYEIK